MTVVDVDKPLPKRSLVRDSSPEVDDEEEDELTVFLKDLWESPINKAMATTLRNVETPVRNNIISHRREELARRQVIEETSIDSTTSSEPSLPIHPTLQSNSDSSSSRPFMSTMDFSPARANSNFLQTSTPAEELSDHDEPIQPPDFATPTS